VKVSFFLHAKHSFRPSYSLQEDEERNGVFLAWRITNRIKIIITRIQSRMHQLVCKRCSNEVSPVFRNRQLRMYMFFRSSVRLKDMYNCLQKIKQQNMNMFCHSLLLLNKTLKLKGSLYY